MNPERKTYTLGYFGEEIPNILSKYYSEISKKKGYRGHVTPVSRAEKRKRNMRKRSQKVNRRK